MNAPAQNLGAAADFRHWRIDTDAQGIAWLTLDKAGASTNTLSTTVLAEFDRVLDALIAATPRGLIIRSGKPTGFIAGADIEEFTAIRSPEDAKRMIMGGWEPFMKLERLPFPTVALIDGFCMGGGLELVLACRYRVAVDSPKTRLALPEVMLGIWPLMGGVMRISRYVAPPAALDMMLTGRAVDARRAKKMGLVDAAVPPRVMENAARSFVLESPRPRKLSLAARIMNSSLMRPLIASQARKQVAKRARPEHYPAPYAILRAWAKYNGDPFAIPDDDPASITHLLRTPTAENLIRVFFLQERLKSLGKDSDFAAKHVHVIGAGVMGGDIAAVCAMRGCTVTLQDVSPQRIAPAIKRSADLFGKRLRDRLRVRDALDRLVPDVNGDGIRRADVIIEAVIENLQVKQDLFANIESAARPTAILATNTSSLKLAAIGAKMKNPTRLVGLHFFNPVPQMQLVEVVAGAATHPDWAKKAAAFVRQIDKLPLPCKDSPGFLVNRVLGPYMANAFRMLEQGIAPEAIDKAAEMFGMPMGPIELADVVGLDICAAVNRTLAGPDAKLTPQLARLIDGGKLGKKTGEGFYVWSKGKPVKGTARDIPPDLADRLIAPFLEEAESAVADEIVADADLADAGLIFGTGFAPFRGGPMHYVAQQEKSISED